MLPETVARGAETRNLGFGTLQPARRGARLADFSSLSPMLPDPARAELRTRNLRFETPHEFVHPTGGLRPRRLRPLSSFPAWPLAWVDVRLRIAR
jgi:hypothetical protein